MTAAVQRFVRAPRQVSAAAALSGRVPKKGGRIGPHGVAPRSAVPTGAIEHLLAVIASAKPSDRGSRAASGLLPV